MQDFGCKGICCQIYHKRKRQNNGKDITNFPYGYPKIILKGKVCFKLLMTKIIVVIFLNENSFMFYVKKKPTPYS
jgi:hypothetical protein